MQNGGLIIVNAGGDKVLFSYKQKSPGDHVANDVILETLGIVASEKTEAEEGGAAEGATGGSGN